jgi:hypothetical protein
MDEYRLRLNRAENQSSTLYSHGCLLCDCPNESKRNARKGRVAGRAN